MLSAPWFGATSGHDVAHSPVIGRPIGRIKDISPGPPCDHPAHAFAMLPRFRPERAPNRSTEPRGATGRRRRQPAPAPARIDESVGTGQVESLAGIRSYFDLAAPRPLRYTNGMSPRKREMITIRVIRTTDPATNAADDWPGTTPEERMDAVWYLTRICLAWNRDDGDQPRLQRSVSRVQRIRS